MVQAYVRLLDGRILPACKQPHTFALALLLPPALGPFVRTSSDPPTVVGASGTRSGSGQRSEVCIFRTGSIPFYSST